MSEGNWIGLAMEAKRRGVPIGEALTQARIDDEPSLEAPSLVPAGSHYRDETIPGEAFPMYSFIDRDVV